MYKKGKILFVILCLILLVACTKKKDDSVILNYANSDMQSEFYKEFVSSMDIKVENVKSDSNNMYIATVSIVLPDLVKLYNDAVAGTEQIQDLSKIEESMSKNFSKTTTKMSKNMNVKKENGKWILYPESQIDEVIAEEIDNFLETVMQSITWEAITIDIDEEAIENEKNN